MALTIKDFQPVNDWVVDAFGDRYHSPIAGNGRPKHLFDLTTGKRYLNESKPIVSCKCIFLALGTPFIQPICGVCNIAFRIALLMSFSHFWVDKSERSDDKCSARCLEASEDAFRIVTQPLSIVGLELAAIYGIFNPYDGRKLYASIERAQYGKGLLAPCFQPSPKRHLLGGSINRRNTF